MKIEILRIQKKLRGLGWTILKRETEVRIAVRLGLGLGLGERRKMAALRWLDRLKNEDIHQIYDVFENTIFKALEHL